MENVFLKILSAIFELFEDKEEKKFFWQLMLTDIDGLDERKEVKQKIQEF